MKPTEADIKAELIEGWEIVYCRSHWLEIRSSITRISFWKHLGKIGLLLKGDSEKHSYAYSPYTDFLTGNYDLSAISKHYESEEWQRIITMCERIVRLITGTEQTLEEDTAKPSYSDLEQRAEDLEKELAKLKADYKELDDEFEVTHQRHCQARKAMERYQAEMLDLKRDRDKLATNYQRECERAVKLQERVDKAEAENASLLEKFGPIDQAEQQVAEVETRFQKLAAKCERMAEILIELNEAIL